MSTNPFTILAAASDILASELNNNFDYARKRAVVLTFGTTIGTAQAVYISSVDGKVYVARGTPIGENVFNFIGWAAEGGTTNDTKKVYLDLCDSMTGLTAGKTYFLSDTAGTVTGTPASVRMRVGIALDANTITRVYSDEIISGTIAANSDVTTSTTPGTNTDTTVTHNLGKLPKLLMISCDIVAANNPSSAAARGSGWWILDGTLTSIAGQRSRWLSSATGTNFGGANIDIAAISNGYNIVGDGATATENITVSVGTMTATTFNFRINGVLTGSDPGTSTVGSIKWMIIG